MCSKYVLTCAKFKGYLILLLRFMQVAMYVLLCVYEV